MTGAQYKDTLATQIYDGLLESIVSRSLASGAKINARQLQMQYNTSSTPVREALGRLVAEGLVEYEANIGYRVARFGRRDIWELNDILAMLDCHAIELAARNPRRELMISELRRTVEAQQKAYDSGDEALYRFATERFHEIFYEFGENQHLTATMRKFNYRTRIMASMYETHENRRISLREHALIYHMIKDGDIDEAVRLMRAHIFETRDLLISQLESEK